MGLSSDRCELEVTVSLVNHAVLAEKGTTWQGTHTCMLLIGDADNSVLCKQKLRFGLYNNMRNNFSSVSV